MLNREHLPVSTQEILNEITITIGKYQDYLVRWSALLEALLMHPHNQTNSQVESRQENQDGEQRYDYSIRWKRISTSEKQILNLIILFTELPIVASLVKLCTSEDMERHPDLRLALSIYSSDRTMLLLYLTESRETKDAFFGRLVGMLRRIRSEVESGSTNVTIFSSPFWKPLPRRSIKKYSGWARHQKDHGAMRPTDHGELEFTRDDEFMKNLLDEIERKSRSIIDSLDLLTGFII